MMYFAANEEERIYLSESSQMDKYLELGYSIFKETDNGGTTLIATPEKGYLVPKPEFPVEERWNPWKGN